MSSISTPAAPATSPAASATPSPVPGRADYPHFLAIPTRWMDNDVYGHVNNVVYYSYFDTVINEHLIREGGLDIHDGTVVGYCVESQCRYLAPLAFPETIDAGLRVAHLGKSSVRYEIALFRQGEEAPAALGSFVHVFVSRKEIKPTTIPPGIRACLERLRR
ncbi:MAG: acyl-CoA thioester hydrolase [Rhodocyclaceae bacterium]|nr:MAG: acyl-CoA thioester hydrolase [Rhodocyclaceae bacterium]TNC99397.1 MAG: acyl-CoA thioester hydrolase [Rhodocyclaceae bacterium]